MVEAVLLSSQWVKQAIVVGTGYPCAGVFIIPTSHSILVDDLVPAIDQVNRNVPKQSRLHLKSTHDHRPNVRLLNNSTDEFVMNDKGTVNRRLTEDKYRDTIRDLYVESE